MTVLEHQDERLAGGPVAEARREQVLERRLAQLRVERGGQIVVRDLQPEDGLEQGSAGHERWVDGFERGLDPSTLLVVRVGVLDAEQAPPDLAPDEVARVRAERLALPEGDEHAAPPGAPDELRDEARLAHAGFRGDPDDPALAREGGLETLVERGELRAPADELQLVADPAPRGALEGAGQLVRHDRPVPALDRQVRQAFPQECVTGQVVQLVADDDAPRGRRRHQPRRQVHRVAEADERAAHGVPVRAAPEPAVGDADLDVAGVGRAFQVAQLQAGRSRSRRVVLVRDR